MSAVTVVVLEGSTPRDTVDFACYSGFVIDVYVICFSLFCG